MSTIGDNLRTLRKEKHISQTKLAKLSGVSNTYINRLENGVYNNPSYDVLIKLANALNIDIKLLTNAEISSEEMSLLEILKSIYNNAPDTDLPLSALIVKQFIKEGLIDSEGNMSPKVKKLLLEAIALQSKIDNVKKD